MNWQRNWKILAGAIVHFNDDDGWAMASHVALSSLLALFPFLIFATALASFLGADAFADTAVHIIFDTWPKSIADPISREVLNVLTVNRSGLLTVSVLAAAFFASNGVEALRVSLNRAYRVHDRRSFFYLRAQSLCYVLVAALIMMVISFLLVLAPLAMQLAREWLPWSEQILTHIENWRVAVAVVLLFAGLLVCHKWLPAGNRPFRAILPGVVVTMACWIAGASLFADYLQRFSTYVATYAGLASIMIALIFLYIIAAIFILGAELNASILGEKRD
jgi:membrane protein